MILRDDYHFKPFNEQHVDLVLFWRNSDRIRANMYSDHIIGKEEHRAWFLKIKQDKTSMCYQILEFKGRPVGLVCFTNIDLKNRKCYYGFYLGETDVPRGSGSVMEFMSLEYAFEILKMRKLCCEVFAFNEPVIKLHKKFGQQEEGKFCKHIAKNGDYQDVICLAIFEEVWRKNKDRLSELVFRRENSP